MGRKPIGKVAMSPRESQRRYRDKLRADRERFIEQINLSGLAPRNREKTVGPFAIVVADPPWKYRQGTTTPDRTIEYQYETAFISEIVSHRPNTAPNAILFLWATAPLLPEALEVMVGWGFTYKTCAVWDKQKIALGYWFRIQHELLLVGIKGKVNPPAASHRIASVFREKRGGHSVKPEAVYEWIEQAFPNQTKLDMYARRQRFGWASWGNEVPGLQ